MLEDPKTWVMFSFFAFLLLLVYLKVPKAIAGALDKRSDDIRNELEEARRLREEAQALLADYQRKQREAEKNAEEIVAQARREAEALTEETRQALADSLKRRTQLAEDKIKRAEAQALEEVRSATIDTAVVAAEKVIAKNLGSDVAGSLVDQAIQGLKPNLN